MGVLDGIVSYFWNETERRLRAPWRVLVAAVVFVAVVFVLSIVFTRVAITAGVEPELFEMEADAGLTGGTLAVFAGLILVTTVGVLVSVWLVARYIDRRRVTDYGFRLDPRWWSDFAFGLALGAVLPTVMLVVGWAVGWYRVTGFFVSEGSFLSAFGAVVVLFVSVGVYEELLVRGWLLTNVAEGLRYFGERWAVVAAVLLTSSLFGVLHLPNPGASFASATIITLAGVFLALGYVLTGELSIPIGIHITWNLFNGSVYGFGVSGIRLPVSFVSTEGVGPEYVTGGEFGPEAGLLGGVAVAVGSAAILWWVRRREGETKIHESVTTPDLR